MRVRRGTDLAEFPQSGADIKVAGTGGGGVAVDDFNADNFDHGPLGFVGGSPRRPDFYLERRIPAWLAGER